MKGRRKSRNFQARHVESDPLSPCRGGVAEAPAPRARRKAVPRGDLESGSCIRSPLTQGRAS